MIVRSPHPDVDIPVVSFTSFVLERAERLGPKPALIDGPTGRTLTYGELATAVRHAAAGLAARGLRAGDVFALCSPNLPEFAVAFHAVATLGGAVTTLNPLLTEEEIAAQLADSGARGVLTVLPLLEKVQAAAERSGVEEILIFERSERAASFADLVSDDREPPPVEIDPREQVVALPYSSGTTGRQKGVMLTHYNLVANLCQVLAVDDVAEEDVMLGVLPFFHIYGMVVVMSVGLRLGSTIVTLPRFELEGLLAALERYRVTRANLVPPIILALAKHPLVDSFDLSRLTAIMSGAAPLGEGTEQACRERLGCAVTQGYGLTETSPVTHLNPPGKSRAGSVGPSLPNTQVKIVDPKTGEALAAGRTGEVRIRGPQVMKGYLNRPDATAAALDAEGWLHTGDVGRVDEEGYLYIVDRLKELIKYKGYQVAPAELEDVLLSHPAVADAAVIPAPHEEAGEVPVAYVVRAGEVSAAEVMAFVAERVAPYKKVRRVEFTDRIPKSASGKILRRVLIERERGAPI